MVGLVENLTGGRLTGVCFEGLGFEGVLGVIVGVFNIDCIIHLKMVFPINDVII